MMQTKLSIICDKFIETCWLAAAIIAPLFMNIYTHRMFEPDKACLIRSVAVVMLVFYIIKTIESRKTASPERIGNSEFRNPQSKIRNLLFISFVLFALAYIISVVFSAVPYNSLWGGDNRAQGLDTILSIWIIFVITIMNLRSQEQLDRLISAIIFTSIPIVAYCFIQRFKADPIQWRRMDTSLRVSATMGNPIPLASYLIMTIPLTLSRVITLWRDGATQRVTQWANRVLRIFPPTLLYGLLVLLQICTVFLSQSRGPILGMFAGILAFSVIYVLTSRQKRLARTVIIVSIGLILFLSLFNLPHLIKFGPSAEGETNKTVQSLWQGTFGKLMAVPYLAQLGRLVETHTGTSGRFRVVVWDGVWKLINDRSAPARFFIGYGPESLSTIYYKSYTMELAQSEGADIRVDRAHNTYLDIWVTNGIIGLVAYLLVLASTFYFALMAFRSANNTMRLITLGLATTIFAHSIETFFGIENISTLVYFWLIIAAIYSAYRLSLSVNTSETIPERGNPKSNKQSIYFFATYVIFTVIVAVILFQYSLSENQVFTPDIQSTKATMLGIFISWSILGLAAGFFIWRSYLFWTYGLLTLTLAITVVSKYKPDGITNSDTMIILIWSWILAGIIIGALCLKRHEIPHRLGSASSVLLGSIMMIIGIVIIVKLNLNPVWADGFYKLYYANDSIAEGHLKKGEIDLAYKSRIEAAKFSQSALRYCPNERDYLFAGGRNFLALAELVARQPQKAALANQITQPPTSSEIIELPQLRLDSFTQRDFLLCSFSCIERLYEINPRNFETLIALIKIYTYWGNLDRSVDKLNQALEYCDSARRVSPLNTKVDDEVKRIHNSLEQMKK